MFTSGIFLVCLMAVTSSMIISDDESAKLRNSSRIMGGSITRHDAMASIRTSIAQGNLHLCGAFIINNRWIGTAAQCVHGRTIANTIVGVGTNLITPTITHALQDIFINGGFNPTTRENDIALLRTVAPIVMGSTTTTIAFDFTLFDTPEEVSILGWGRSSAAGSFQNTLLRAVFRIVPSQQCRDGFSPEIREQIHGSHICTHWVNRATCPGDAGGPIIFNDRVVGIVSWVEPCFGGTVNVNTRIASFVDWIILTIFS